MEIERHAATVLGLTGGELRTFVEDVWTEYLGTLNRDLARYFASLRPRYRTGILSNSFVGARELERRLDTGAAGPASRGGRGAW